MVKANFEIIARAARATIVKTSVPDSGGAMIKKRIKAVIPADSIFIGALRTFANPKFTT
jgi:hypothetical protein